MKEQVNSTLPKGWAWATIEELIDSNTGLFKDGDWIETKDQNQLGDVKLIQLADIGDGFFRNRSDRFMNMSTAINLKCTFLKGGDILVARMPDPIARACIFPYEEENKYVTIVDVVIIRIGENSFDKKLLMHFINSPVIRKQAEELQTGTTRKRISKSNLSLIKIPIPPINEQKRITYKIEELFSELEKGKNLLLKNLQRLHIYRQALLKSAFNGNLTEGWRKDNNSNDAKFLIQNLDKERQLTYDLALKIWKENLKEWNKNGKIGKRPQKPTNIKFFEPINADVIDSLPEKPKNWAYCRIGQISNLTTGYAFKSDKFVKDGFYKVIRMGNLYDNKLDMSRNPVFLPKDISIDEVEKYKASENDILLTLTGTKNKRDYGFVVKIPEGEKNLLINQRILLVRSLISNEFIYYLLQTPYFRDQFFSFETGGGSQGNVSSISVEQIIVALPPLSEQEQIVKILKQQLTNSSVLEYNILNCIAKIERLHQSILNMAFQGKLVPQDLKDEPAQEFLNKLEEGRKIKLSDLDQQIKQQPKRTKKMNKELTIEEVLKASNKSMSANDVWLQSIHRNSIENFYQELKKLEEKVKIVTKGTETMLTLIK